MLVDVSVISAQKVVFKGKAQSVILPGEQGTFEILAFHKPILSRLVSGELYVDDTEIPITRGIVKASKNRVTVIVEE